MSSETRVFFTAPESSNDLRVVLTQHSATDHDHHQVAYITAYGETRFLKWLTKFDAHIRAKQLRNRGYRVAVSTMAV